MRSTDQARLRRQLHRGLLRPVRRSASSRISRGAFLRRDVEGAEPRVLTRPSGFSQAGRTEMAVRVLYEETAVFHGATFADMKRQGGPLVLDQSSDLKVTACVLLYAGVFQPALLGFASFPVARAVTASSAVPVVFNSGGREELSECKHGKPDWLVAAEATAEDDPA